MTSGLASVNVDCKTTLAVSRSLNTQPLGLRAHPTVQQCSESCERNEKIWRCDPVENMQADLST